MAAREDDARDADESAVVTTSPAGPEKSQVRGASEDGGHEKVTSASPARGYSWPAFERGNVIGMRHGACSPHAVEPIARQLVDELVAVAPWCARDAFTSEVEAWAWAEARCRLLRAWINEHGVLSDEGLKAAGELHRAETHAANLRSRLGLTPAALVKLLATVASAAGPSDTGVLEALQREGRQLVEAYEQRTAELER